MNRASSGLAVLLCVAACARPASKTDFIKDAIQGDIGEIQLGQLAEQKASKPDVRDFGEMLVTDHTQSALGRGDRRLAAFADDRRPT